MASGRILLALAGGGAPADYEQFQEAPTKAERLQPHRAGWKKFQSVPAALDWFEPVLTDSD